MSATNIPVASSNHRVSKKLFGSRKVCAPVFVSALCLLFGSGNVLNLLAYPLPGLTPVKAFQQEATTLSLGAALERELKGGEVHSFRVSLVRGQFLHALVEQRGMDVVVAAFGPDGKRLFSVDSPNGSWGSEPVVLIAETSGDYRLEVRAANEKAPAARYEIKIAALREATEADRNHVTAQRIFEEADSLRTQGKADSRRAAIEKYKRALSLFQMAGERAGQALTFYALGLAHAELSEFRSTLEYTDLALPLFRALGDDTMEGFTLNLMGGAYDFLGEVPKAVEYFNQALLLFQKQGNHASEASVLNNIGRIYYQNADWQKALENYSQALALFRSAKDRNREAIALQNLGVIYFALGEQQKALDYFQQALLLGQATSDKRREALAVSEIGYVWNSLGAPQKALDYYNQALPIWQAAGDRNGQATTLDYMGMAYSALGELEKSLNYHRQALELKHAAGNPREEANTLGNIGHVYNQSGQPQQALGYYNQALTLFRALEDRERAAAMLQGIASSERQLGNLSEARQHVEDAISLVEAVRAGTFSQQFRASYFASKQDAYALYIDILMQQHRLKPSEGYDALALAVSERARARSLVELLNESHFDIREGVDPQLIERERNLTQTINAKAQRQIQLLAQKGAQEQIDALKREINALEDEYQQVQASIRKQSPRYTALARPVPLDLAEIRRQALDKETLLLEYSLGEERSYLWVVGQDSLKTYELPKGIEIEQAALDVNNLLTARSQSKKGETAGQREQRIAKADSELPEAAQKLSAMLLGEAAPELGNKRLVIIPDGALQYIPFGMLPAPAAGVGKKVNQPLIVEHEVISLPSASTIAIQRQSLMNRQPAPNLVAVIADPVFENSDERFKVVASKAVEPQQQGPAAEVASTRILEQIADDKEGRLRIPRLPYTRQEAEQILALAPRANNLKALDFQANRSVATSETLGKYRYVHFATHGYIDGERPDLSALVLSLVDEQGKQQDGFLRVNEIYNLRLSADMVVLSACQTGLGKRVRGEGLEGLTRGFMYAGAARVVVSLWNVSDKATSELMTLFYKGILKEKRTPAAALRAAQIEMWKQKQWQAPYYWSAFILQGEWR